LKSPNVLIIDYGIGNLLSVRRGFEFCGADVEISSDPKRILNASHLVLPGVGAFGNAMAVLRERGLFDVVKEVEKKGTPLLAICLGMQMLLNESQEFGVTTGLGMIPGKVIPIPSLTASNQPQKIPHIGWSELLPEKKHSGWKDTILENVKEKDSVYFVHSFMSVPNDDFHRLANCEYGGQKIAAVIRKDNIYGCQFHPEKSGEVGLKILSQFIKL
jgi:glutamine amidotransferase